MMIKDFEYENEDTNFGNINERLMAPSKIWKLGFAKLKFMGFKRIADEDIHPYRSRYKDAREKVKN